MRSRWFHKPELHTPLVDGDRKSTWLELFYDLIFVTSFVQLSKGLGLNINPTHFALFVLVFSVLWFSWLGFTLFSNRFSVDDFIHRILVFFQMISVAAVSAFASGVLNGEPSRFSLSYSAAQMIVAMLFMRSLLQAKEGKRFSRYWSVTLFAGSVIWMIAAFIPQPAVYGLWAFGLIVFLAAPFSRRSRASAEESPADLQHLARRLGILTTIVLSEVFLQVMSTLSADEFKGPVLLQAALTLLVAFSIWWIYFDDIVTSYLKNYRFSLNYWLYAHLPLHGAIVALGLALQKAVQLDYSEPAPGAIRWLLSLSLAGVYFSVAALDSVTERRSSELNGRTRIGVRLAGAAFVLVLAPIGQGMMSGVYLMLIALSCAAQVAVDMFMAPNESPESEPQMIGSSELARKQNFTPFPRQIRMAEVVRKNAPSELRSDLYFYFIEGSWTRFLIVISVCYILINVFFAGVYMLQPGSIAGSRPESFADAFYFSVQTFSTIGYGQLNPSTDFSNVVVVVEAAVGLAGVALVTGLMFTKAAKPRPGIMFSRPVLITPVNGVPHLMFRVGNTRGNEVVSAEINVSALRDEVSSEGQHLRRMYDLNLVRSRSPFFGLTWLILHKIDASSPFSGVTSVADIESRILQLSCILTGHDSTYGQTIYMRHVYQPSDFFVGAEFVDILGQLPDGTTVVDYAKFHDMHIKET